MAFPPPMAPLSDEELAKDQSPWLLPIFIIFTILPILAVGSRVLVRNLTSQKLWADDWLMVASAGLCVIQFAFLIKAIDYGLGKHAQAVPLTSIEPYLLYTYLSELWYATAVTCIKLSILFLYLRIFHVHGTFVKVCYGTMVFVVAWGIAVLFTTIFQCTPVAAAWDKTIPNLKCFVLADFVIGSNVPNILADALIISLPIPLLWSLKLSMWRKLGLIALFMIAAVTTVISIIRCVLNANIDVIDATWSFVNVAIFSTVEVSVGVCCACMPVVYPLFRLFVGRRVHNNTQVSSNNAHMTYGNISSRKRQRLSSQDKEEDTDQLWSISGTGSAEGLAKERAEIPMNQIMVTRDLDVDRQLAPESRTL